MELFNIIMMTAIFLPCIAAFPVWLFAEKSREKIGVYTVVVSIVECILVAALALWNQKSVIVSVPHVMGLGLHFTFSGVREILALLSVFAWTVVMLFSGEYHRKDTAILRINFYYLLTLGAVLGIFYAADFITLLMFFEIMSFTSFMWIAHRQTKEALYAAGTYLGIAIAGGLAILMGTFIIYSQYGTVMFDELAAMTLTEGENTWLHVAACCMFAGFGAKASAFPVHAWLPDSYTQAPTPATALLSAILSKTGIFGMMCVSRYVLFHNEYWSTFILIIGVITMVIGGVRGVCSSNLKTTLAFSSMSQLGFIIVGIGMQGLLKEDNILVVRGTILHMVNHSLVKLVLFLVAGIIFMQVGSFDLNRVRGFGHKKPFLQISFLLGAAGVGGIPLLNGYISKTLLHESIVEYQEMILQGMVVQADRIAPVLQLFRGVEALFLFSGGLTLAYMTKLYVVLFIEKNQDKNVQKSFDENKNYGALSQKMAILLAAIGIPVLGLLPHQTSDVIMNCGMEFMGVPNDSIRIAYFSLTNLSGAVISILVAAVVYFTVVRCLMLRKKQVGYMELWPAWLNTEKYIYRKICYQAIPFLLGILSRVLDSLLDGCVVVLRKTVFRDKKLPHELTEGDSFTHMIGKTMEVIHNMYCKLSHKPCEEVQYEHKVALKEEDFVENLKIIERSLSFGLFMFCLGLSLTLLYLFLAN